MLPVDNFARAVENKFADLFVSLLSDPHFTETIVTSAPCNVSTSVQRWEYRPFGLLLSYSIAAAASLLAVAAGAFAIRENGYGMDTSFSTLLATTRNPDIDALMRGCCLGKAPLPKQILKTRLMFGEIKGSADDSGASHVAFGLEGAISPIVPGKRYL